MFFTTHLTVPAGTTKYEKAEVVLPIEPGMIRHVWVGFPQGCVELVHVTIHYHGWQVWPRPTDENITWNNFVYDFDDSYPITAEPYELVIKGWNEDDSYQHRIMFACRIDESPREGEVVEVSRVLEDLGLMKVE